MTAHATDAARWAQAPEVPARRSVWGSRRAREVAGAVLVLAGPAARSQVAIDGRPWLVVLVGLAAWVFLGRLSDGRWPLRLAVPVLAGALLVLSEGEVLALWLVASLYVVDWAVRRRPPLPWLPPAGAGAVAPVAVILAVALWRGRTPTEDVVPLLFVALAGLVTAVGAWSGERMDRLARAVGSTVGAAVARFLFVLVGLPLVVLPWLAHRLWRVDPLAARTAEGTAWVPRWRLEVQPKQPWAPENTAARSGRMARARSALAVPTVLLGALLVWSLFSSPTPETLMAGSEAPSDAVPAAYDGEPWYPEYAEDLEWVMDDRVSWRPLRAMRIMDVTTRHVNVDEGVRVTWRPPPCACRRLEVWIYGGSTTFGFGQRDEHTIASELAKLAYAKGYVLDVVNRGVPGHLHWNEAHRFAWDLTLHSPPDLVIFYDGVNEQWAASQINAFSGLDDPHVPIEPLTEEIWEGVRSSESPPEVPDGARFDEPAPLDYSRVELARIAMQRYDTARNMSRASSEASGVPVRWFWQPSRGSRPNHPDEPRLDPPNERDLRAFYREAESLIPPDVVDLSGVFDDVDAPLFSDDVHHNEDGARIVAASILAEIEGELRELRGADDR